MGSEEVDIVNKLREEGFDLTNCSATERILYVWKLYLSSEDELKNSLSQLDSSRRQHAAEMQQIEAYVEQIKCLSDEREALTLDLEKDNDLIKMEIEREKTEVADMLSQQGLDDVITTSVPEQVAFLLVERAKLMDALEQQMSMRSETADNQPITQEQSAQTLAEADNSKCGELSPHNQTESWQNECENCKRLQKERNQLSTKYVVADEQAKSLERRVARYKVLLGEDAVNKEDTISDLQDELQECKNQLAERTGELNSTTSELGQVQTILNSLNEKYETYEQSCQPFDVTQTSLNRTHGSLATTGSQPDENVSQLLQDKITEVESLQKELAEVKDNAAAELEKVIMDYEEKLEASGDITDGQSKFPDRTQELSREKSKLEMELRSTKSKLEDFEKQISQLQLDKSELEARAKAGEQEILTYQNELEQILANQEEDAEKIEQLQQQLQYATSVIDDLKHQIASGDQCDGQELNVLQRQFNDLESQHSELLEKLSSLTTEYESMMEKLDMAATENEENKMSLQKMTNDYTGLQQVHEILSDEVEQLMGEKGALVRSNAQLKQQIKAEEEFHAEELADGDEKLSTLTIQFSDLEEAKARAEEECEDLKARIESLTKQEEELSQTQQKMSGLESQVVELEADNFKLAESVRSLTAKLQQKSEEVVKIELEKEYIKSDMESLSAELEERADNSEKAKLNLDKQYSELSDGYDRLNREHQLLLAEHKDLDNKLTLLRKEHKALNEEYKDSQMDFDMLNEQYQLSQQTNRKALQRNEELSHQCKKLEDEMVKVEEQCKKLENELRVGNERKFDQVDGRKKAEVQSLKELRSKEKAEWHAAMAEEADKNVDLTERVILLEKAANQLEGDNRELASKLQETLSVCERNEEEYKAELEELKSSNATLQEQVERLKAYSDSLEKEVESLQTEIKKQSSNLQGDSKNEEEILALKSEISRLNSNHMLEIDSLELRLKQSTSDCVVIKDSFAAKAEELSAAQSQLVTLQSVLEEESFKCRQLENKNRQLQSEFTQHTSRLEEANERRAQVERENQRLADELKESLAGKTDSLLTSMHETDCNKALELAESRITSLENERGELKASLAQVNLELKHANQTVNELSSLKVELQAKREEILAMQSKLNVEQVQRSFEDRKVEELKLNLMTTNQREVALQDQNNELRHKLLDLELKLSKLQSDKTNVQNELTTVEVKTKSATQKMSDLTAEKETLEIELMAANEKLELQAQRYQERKTRHRARLRTARVVHDTETAKLKDKIERLDREVALLTQSVSQERQLKTDLENKCSTLTVNHRNLLSRQVDLEDEIRERNRGIALLQTKLQYTEKDNKRLTELCSRLKTSTRSLDILDTVALRRTIH